ncbi:MAG: RagB/SusD family nutrient uptake outer membrane protein [Prolixibacteraceae bacterium]|nr:RagB/SusD family nutrient uptake outer membrane protein [Prolixibacteraceae bacterium]
MKKIFSLIILTMLAFACSEDFLNKQPEDALSTGSYYNNPTEIKTGLVACYKNLQNIYNQGDLPLILELMSDDGKDFGWSSVWHVFTKTNSNSQSGIWNNCYKMIVTCNNMIAIIDNYEPKDATEEALVKVYRGEATFLRALGYFNLVRIYGDVPKVVDPFSDPNAAFGIGRTSVADIYNSVIIPDLEFAFANCYKKGDTALKNEEARATKGAALTILGKVYLTMNNPAKAAETLKKLVVDKAAGTYSLLPDYKSIFQPNNKFSSESIFEVNFNVAAGQPSYWYRWMGVDIGKRLATVYSNQLLVEHNLMRDFVNSNELTRYVASIDSGKCPGDTPPIQAWASKLAPTAATVKNYGNTGTDYNYMVTRYADALLMYAEALMLQGQKTEALTYFNQVRARVKPNALITEAELNIDQILHERRMELAFEGHRYFDLVRTGKAVSVLTKSLMTKVDYDDKIYITGPIAEYQLILPIPVGEIEKDPTLTQNSGY